MPGSDESPFPSSTSPEAPRSLVDILRRRSAEQPQQVVYTLLNDRLEEAESLTYGELGARVAAVSARLQQAGGSGERALLLYPSGLDFVTAFLACLYAGVVAVPTYPPRSRRSLPRLEAIAADSRPRLILTTSALLPRVSEWTSGITGSAGVVCLATDESDPGPAPGWSDPGVGPETLAFLQYTSGSTALPKGVEVSHGNLLHNEEMIRRAFRQSRQSTIVSWLPLYHDMGLIGGVLQPAYVGARCILLSPIAFLQRPARWLEAISRYRATTSGGPNFAYDLCVRKVLEPERAGLDLSSWEVAFNGAEQVRAETLDRFAAAFGPVGFRRRAFYPCYGLAEATLLVTGGDPAAEPVLAEVDGAALEQGRASRPEGAPRRLVGCGRPAAGLEVVVADPKSGRRLAADRVGEIWVAGPNVARGYWGRAAATRETFHARLARDPGAGPFLRTGDLGFLRDGELFVTGRSKDLIILRGRNLYPQDVELTAERAHPALRPGCGAAFSIDVGGAERLVVVYELERTARGESAEAAAEAVARAVAEEHEVAVHEVLLVRAGAVPKTSSGKLQRRACRALYLAGDWETLGRSAEVEQAAEVEAVVYEPEDLAVLPPDERREALDGWLRREVARLARVPVSRISSGQALTGLLDSLAIIQLKASLEERTGAPLPLSALFDGETLDDLGARLAGGLGGSRSELEAEPTAEATSGEMPLSFGQRALWFEGRLAPESAAYHLPAALRVTSPLDVAALARAFKALAERHPVLRTTFHARAGEPVQRVHPRLSGSFLDVDAAGWGEVELQERLRREVARPFDLEAGPAFRVRVFRRAPGGTLLVVVIHHLVADYWSLAVLARDLGALYDREAGGLPPPPTPAASYGDFVRWQERRLAGAEGESLWAWWREELGFDLPRLELPTDRPRPAVRTDRGAAIGMDLAPELADAVRALARSRGVTVFNALLAAFVALLHRWTGQEDLVVGAPTAGRGMARWAEVVGYFVNPVPLRLILAGGLSFAALLDSVRSRVAGALEHQHYPLPLLVERQQRERDPSRSPLFQAMLVFQRPPRPGDEALAALSLGRTGPPLTLGSLAAEPVPITERTSQLDLALTMAEIGGSFGASLRYNTDLFDAATVGRLLGHFRNLLAAAVDDAGLPVSDLPLLSAAEASQVLLEWNDTGEMAAGATCVHHLFVAQAARSPEAVALVGRGERLTYGELQARALQLARRLRALGVGPEVRVGVLLERSGDLVAALLGVLAAGGAYVPLDPAYPRERLRWMLEDSRCAVLLTRDSLAGLAGETDARVLDLGGALAAGPGSTAALPLTVPGNLAYVIYTSGSTGRPKGVAVEHRSIVALVRWARQVFSPAELSGVLAATSVCFDLSVFELFVPLSSAGRVLLAADALDLPSLPWAGEVRLINTVPSVCAELLRLGGLPPGVRTVNLAGEPLTRALAERIWESSAGLRVLNLYGPSEDTTYSTWEPVSRQESLEPAIGRPVAGSRAYVLDPSLRPLGAGVPGQLHLGGAGLARGYLGRPELTAERFLPDPHGGKPGQRLYATGDLARWRPDGRLEFLGRIDHQVKVRGFRIELGEVEACLAGHPEVAEAAVLARGDRLVAFVVPRQTPGPSPAALRSRTSFLLPAYMVPSAFAVLATLPRTASGKVDRKALAALPVAGGGEGDEQSPAVLTVEEELLTEIWCEVLELEKVGRQENFFALGGHSLLAVRVLSRVREALGVVLPVRSVFEAPTVAVLAARIAAARRSGMDRQVPCLIRAPRSGPLPLSFAQERLWFLARLEPDSPWYNIAGALRLEGALDAVVLRAVLSGVVRRHEALRTGFVMENGRPVQVIHPPDGLPLPVVDLAALHPECQEAEVRRQAGEEARRPFDLTRGTPLRAVLMRLSAEEHLLLLVVHHIAADGWSLGVLVRELAALYGGTVLPELPVQYADFAVWQRAWLTPEVLERQLGYWRERLAGIPVLELPADRPRPAVRGWRGARCTLAAAEQLTAVLRDLGRQEGATPFMVLLAGFAALLSRLTGETDLTVGTPVAGRDRLETEGVIGCFVNTLVLRIDLGGEPDFRAVVRRVREATLEGHAHQDAPFEKVVEDLRPERSLTHSPLFQALFAIQNVPLESFAAGGVACTPRTVDNGAAQFDVSLLAAEAGQGLALSLVCAADLFDPATAERLLGYYHALLAGAAGDELGNIAIGEIPLMSAAEALQVLAEWNDTGDLERDGRLEFLAALPWTARGRVRRKAAPVPTRSGAAGGTAARGVEEELLAALWCEILEVGEVSREDDFFALGGHSLLAVRVLARVREAFGVELPVRSVFAAPTLAALAARIRAAREAELPGAGRSAPPLTRVPRGGPLPLSHAQERLWFLAQLEPDSPWYNLAGAVRLQGPLQAARLQSVLSEVARRHQALRTGFVAEDGRPRQVIHPPRGMPLPVLDLSSLPRERREAEALRQAGEEARRPFDLARGAPIRAALARLSGEEHLLVLAVHHIVSDGWSLAVLVREVGALYGGSMLTELPVQYADFALWQRGWLTGEVVERQLAYWRERLAGVPVLELPADRARPAVRRWRGASRPLEVGEELAAALRTLARREEATLFMVLLAGFLSLLRRLTGEPDLAVGSPVAGRDRVETEGLIGFFINTLVLRADLGGEPGFRAVLRQVREAVLEAHAHQDVPFERLVEELRPQRSLSHSPLFQVLFGFQGLPLPAPALPGLQAEAIELERTASRFDLSLALEETLQGLRGTATWDTDLFDAQTVQRWTHGLFRLLAGAVSDPARGVLDLPLLSAGEAWQILGEWNDREAAYPLHLALHELVAAQAARTPDGVAVSFEGRTLTYREMDARADALALRLCAAAVGAEILVALCVERSFEMVVGLLAILKAGGAWVPLDPSYPAERLALMLADARPPVLLSQAHLADRLPPYGGRVLLLDALEGEPAAGAAMPSRIDPDSPAYVIFTSGSTGRPKGAVNTHRAIVNRLLEMQDAFALGSEDAILQKTPLSFDVSVWEVFWPLIAGARVALAQPGGHQDTSYLAEAIVREAVTTLHFVPSVLQLFLDQPGLERCAGLRRVMVGGEALSPELARSFHTLIGTPFGVELINFYGPAEAAVEIATWRCGPRDDRAPIGRPVANTRIHLLDPEGRPAPIGVAAELHAGGIQIGRGYLRRPDLTAERFVPDPLGPPGSRLYRTGDLARWLPDGTLDFLGRTDHQVKLRGFRLEPGEIEAVLARHPAVLESAVVLREGPAGTGHLVAWYAPRPGLPPSSAELRDFLRLLLPEPWIPALFLPVEALPRLPAGKVDRRALATRETGPPESGGPEAPRTAGEEIAAGLFAELLGLPRVGANEDFFALGGHSLLATRLASRVRQAFGVELPLRRLFEAPTPAALARAVDEARREADGFVAPPLVPLPRDGALPLSFAQQRLWLLDQLDPGSPAYNLPATVRLEGRLDDVALERALAAIIRRHEALRTLFPAPAGEPVQEVRPPGDFFLPRVDLAAVADASREAGCLAIAEARRPFDLARGPLARACLVRLRHEENVLLFTLHHIVADGWSIGILARELAALYRTFTAGEPSPLAALPVQYADFARWQRGWMKGDILERGLAYWRGQLAGAPRALDLPADRPRPAVPSQRGATRVLRLPEELQESLAALARREGATLFMALLAALQALLFRITGRDDLVVGSPVANRDRAETEGLIGFFVNLLALRVRLGSGGRPASDATGRELLAQVRDMALAAYAHQEVPFEKVAAELDGEWDSSRTPLFQVVFAFQEELPVREVLSGLILRPLVLDTGTAKFDLALSVRAGKDGLQAYLEHSTDLFDGATIDRLGRCYASLLSGMAADPQSPLSGLLLLGAVERAQLVVEWNDTGFDVPGSPFVQELFSTQARQRPAAPAVVATAETLTYGELARRAGRLARTLRGLGVGPEVPVGVHLDRSPELVVAFLGILQAGGVYVPLDPAQPAERVALLVADTGMPVLLARGDWAASLPPLPTRVLPVESWEETEEETRAHPTLDPDNLAYVVYTSGSTGRPKGVEVSHRSLANLVAWHRGTYGVTAADRVPLVAGVGFDASVWEIWPCLTAGACLLVPEEEIRVDAERLPVWIEAHGVTLSFLPTPLAEGVLATRRPLGEGFRFLLTGGDRLRRRAPRQSGFSLVNHYGPTEATVVATAGIVPPESPPAAAAPSIGRPIGNTSAHLLDSTFEPVPIGVVGELCIGGAGVARGYLRQPHLTAERFVPDPFQPGARLYRTGDLARRLPDGSHEFVGRIDHQVKIRGHRIELGEVEVVLAEHPGVRQAVVEARGSQPEDLALVAYLAVDGALEAQELRAFLHRRLPAYMVPAAFVLLPELPLTPHGKVDRRALPSPAESPSAGRDFVRPRTPVEQVLAALWQQLLQREQVGLHDDFFELGGHSLLATRLASRLRQVFKVDLSLRRLLQDPTVAGMTSALVASEAAPGETDKIARIVQRLHAMSGAEVRERLRSAGGGAS